jgi:hypothetical protein
VDRFFAAYPAGDGLYSVPPRESLRSRFPLRMKFRIVWEKVRKGCKFKTLLPEAIFPYHLVFRITKIHKDG